MLWLLETYRQVPPELIAPLSAILAATFTGIVAFVGVLLGNRAAAQRQRTENKAAEARARIERDQSLRRTVYLETLKELAGTLQVISIAWNFNRASDLDPEARSTTYQARLIAGPKTQRALAAVDDATTSALDGLVVLRLRHGALATSQKQFESFLDRITTETRMLLDEQKNQHLEADRSTAIDVRLTELRRMRDKIIDHLQKLTEQSVVQTAEIAKLGNNRQHAIEKPILELINCMREELELVPIEVSVMEIIKSSSDRARAAVDAALSDVQRILPALFLGTRADDSSSTSVAAGESDNSSRAS
jgi:hypothetical protein